MDTDDMDRLLVFHQLRATREVSFLPPRRPNTFNDQDPTTTRPPSVPTSLPEGVFLLYFSQTGTLINTKQSPEPTNPSSPSPPSQDTDQTSALPPSPAHLPSANPNDPRRTPQRRSSVDQRPRRRLLRRKSKGVDEGVFCD